MQYLFIPKADGKKVKDGVRGNVVEIPDGATVQTSRPILTSLDGITDYVAPVPSLPPQQALAAAVKSGLDVTVGETTYCLKCADTDLALFAQLATLILTAQSGMTSEEKTAHLATTTVITDAASVAHVITIGAFQELVVAYGLAYNALWAAAAAS